jgi:hypothetical protein
LRIVLTLVMGAALILSIVSSWKDRQELQKVIAANNFLRKSLGDMTIALTASEKELNRLQQAGCPSATQPKR